MRVLLDFHLVLSSTFLTILTELIWTPLSISIPGQNEPGQNDKCDILARGVVFLRKIRSFDIFWVRWGGGVTFLELGGGTFSELVGGGVTFFYIFYLFAAEIQFFMIFTFSLLHARAFVNGQISCPWKNRKTLITFDWGLLDDFWGHFWRIHFFDLFAAEIWFFRFRCFWSWNSRP